MARSRRPRDSRGAAATSHTVPLVDDESDENQNENVASAQSEAIDENSNSNSNSNDITGPVPGANEGRQLRSNVWNYAKKISKDKAECIKCKLSIKTPGGGTTALRKHLMAIHNLTQLALEANPRTKTNNSITLEKKTRLDHLAYLAIFEDGRTFGDLRKK